MNKAIEVFYYYTERSASEAQCKKVYLNLSSIESFCDIGKGSSFEYYSVRHEKSFCIHSMNVLIISVSGEYYFSKSNIDKFLNLSECISINNRFEILDL